MVLENIGLFQGLSTEKVEKYESIIEIKAYKKNEVIFNEGDPPDFLWFVADGEVKVFKDYASGKSAIMGVFGQGGTIAEVAVIDGNPYPASCQAITDAKMVVMKREDALEFMTANPSVAHKLMMALGRKLREITSNLGSMAVQSVTHRLSRFLLKMADKMGEEGEDGTRIKLFLTRKDLAECIGTSFEVVVRCLSKLQKEGIIEVEGKTVIIHNRMALEDLAEE